MKVKLIIEIRLSITSLQTAAGKRPRKFPSQIQMQGLSRDLSTELTSDDDDDVHKTTTTTSTGATTSRLEQQKEFTPKYK
jgi:hypothetical protein